MEYKSGDMLCSCRLLQKCGEGSYGEVWLACDAVGGKVAVKIVRNGGRYSERELAGLQNYKNCNHPNLLKIRHVEITPEYIFCTMDAADDLNKGCGEYCPDTLAERLNKWGRLDSEEINSMLSGLLSGLEELHKQGLVHRDIKPDNILWVNGRPTLADVGLIAFEGAGSLVGSPGFLSPRVLAGSPAEASDDFYALGKVIYCALTGLAVSEYPSIPADMTLHIDVYLNKALLKSCSEPIHSATEFRKLLKGKNVSSPPKQKNRHPFPLQKMGMILGGAVILGMLGYLFIQQQKMAAKHIVQPVPVDAESERKMAVLRNLDNDFQKELQEKVLSFFRKSGWFENDNLLPFLLNYELMNGDIMRELLLFGNEEPRLKPLVGAYRKSSRMFTTLELELHSMLSGIYYPDFDKAKVGERRSFWKNRGNIKAMLTTDPVMQAVALDSVIRKGINKILEHGSFRANEKAELKELIDLRHALLDPEWGKLQFVAKKIR